MVITYITAFKMSGHKEGMTGILLKRNCRVKTRDKGWGRGGGKIQGVHAWTVRQNAQEY